MGICGRSLRRWRGGYEQHGYDGLFERRRGKPRPKCVPLGTGEEQRLYQEEYADCNVRHFPEKRREAPRLERRYPWVKLALQGAGLVKQGRPRPGRRWPLDGRRHRWIGQLR